MALIDVDMVSGFEPDIEELEMQQKMFPHLTPYTRPDFVGNVLSFYFDDVSLLSRRPYKIMKKLKQPKMCCSCLLLGNILLGKQVS